MIKKERIKEEEGGGGGGGEEERERRRWKKKNRDGNGAVRVKAFAGAVRGGYKYVFQNLGGAGRVVGLEKKLFNLQICIFSCQFYTF